MGRVFSAYGTPLMAVSLFRYLGQKLSSSFDNWPSVERNRQRVQGKWGRLAKILGREVTYRRKVGRFYVAVVQAVPLFGSKTWVLTPPVGEIPRGVSPPGGAEDGGHGTQKLTGWDMGVPTHWDGDGNGGTGGDWGVYLPLPENGCTTHCDSYYHGLVFSSRAESRNAPIQAMVGSARPGYPGDTGGTCSSRGGGEETGIE